MSNKLSVIIPVWQKHELAVVHVRECMNSSRVPDEIIVVNDGGEDDLKDKLKNLEKNTKIIYAKILPPKIPWNYTGARNLGFWLSSGDYVSIEDQDHIPHKDFYLTALEEFKKYPELLRCRSKWRYEVDLEDILNNPKEKWVIKGGRQPHHDCCVLKRELYLQLKGYDERFAGEYGWSNTNWRRRLTMIDWTGGTYPCKHKLEDGKCRVCGAKYNHIGSDAGFQYVVNAEKTRGLSYRNFRLARKTDRKQSPIGILNFEYEYEILN
jgi:glycosyltransferase involved in cell wall biosynthesis